MPLATKFLRDGMGASLSMSILLYMTSSDYYGMIPETATVTSNNMIDIPAKIRKKYSIKAGTKIVFIDNDKAGLEMIPVPSLSELFGADRKNKDVLLASVRELENEHRKEALLDKKKLG